MVALTQKRYDMALKHRLGWWKLCFAKFSRRPKFSRSPNLSLAVQT